MVLVAFALVQLLSVFGAADPAKALWFLGITVYLELTWVLFTGLMTRFGERATVSLGQGYLTGALASAVLGIVVLCGAFPELRPIAIYGPVRIQALFKDPNVLGSYLIPGAIYCLVRVAVGRSRRWTWLTASAILVAGTVFSFSRASWGTLIVALLVAALLWARSVGRRAWRQLVLGVAGLAIIVLIAVVAPQTGPYFKSRLMLQSYDADRFRTQRIAWDAGVAHPLGIGPGQSEIVFQYATHNTYLRVFAESGWFALCAYSFLIAASLGRAFRSIQCKRDDVMSWVIFACLVAMLVNGIVIDTLHWRNSWMLLALCWTLPLGSVPLDESS
jgi:O-antigen ligase